MCSSGKASYFLTFNIQAVEKKEGGGFHGLVLLEVVVQILGQARG